MAALEPMKIIVSAARLIGVAVFSLALLAGMVLHSHGDLDKHSPEMSAMTAADQAGHVLITKTTADMHMHCASALSCIALLPDADEPMMLLGASSDTLPERGRLARSSPVFGFLRPPQLG